MKKKTTVASLAFTAMLLFVLSCENTVKLKNHKYEKEDYELLSNYLRLPESGHDYTLDFPDYYGGIGFFSSNLDEDLVTLGRVLFYDKNLSSDGTVSCASCHDQSKAFSDDVAFSEGVEQRIGDRNSIALGSVFSFSEYYAQENSPGGIPFLWDNSALSPQEQISRAFLAENEMGISSEDDIVPRIMDKDYYKVLYKYAYGTEVIEIDGIKDALASFVNSIGSFSSKYDEARDYHYNNNFYSFAHPESLSQLSEKENQGMRIYLNQCGTCHGGQMNAPDRLAENNGLDAAVDNEDLGVGGFSGNTSEYGRFKVPSLRNVALTAPYMHDGRFQTLEEVIEHYSNGIQSHPNLSNELKTGNSPKEFDFSNEEKEAILAFLETLTDNQLLTDDKYSNPFK